MADEVTPGAAPAAPAQAQTPPPAQQQQQQQQPPAAIALPPDEVQRLYGISRQFEELRARQAAAVEAEQHKATIALAQKGEVEKAFGDYKAAQDQKVATLQTALLNREKSLVVSGVMAGVPFISPEAAAQARELLELRCETSLDGNGNVVVRDRATGRPMADTGKEQLGSPAFAHFLQPRSQGGGGAGGGNVPAPSGGQGQGADLVAPSNPGQQAYADWLGQVEANHKAGYGGIGFGGRSHFPGVGPAVPATPGVRFGGQN